MNNELKSKFDVDSIKTLINIIKKYIIQVNSEGFTDSFEIEMKILETFPEQYQTYPFLIKKLCKKEDISMVYHMLENLEKVDSGEQSFQNVESTLGKQLANKYLYPNINKFK
jgi:hypothetical protein